MTPDEIYAAIQDLDDDVAELKTDDTDFWTKSADIDEKRADLWQQIAQHGNTHKLPAWTGDAATIASMFYREQARYCRREGRR